MRDAASRRQSVFFRRRGCLILVYLLGAAPPLLFVFLNDESYRWSSTLWIFGAMIAAFFAVRMTTQMWVMPALQAKFDKEMRQYARDDTREYVVLLRGFTSQILKRKSGGGGPEPGNLMVEIANAIPDHLAVVCIGAGETIRGLGAPSTYTPLQPSNQDWVKVLAVVAVGARAIVITPNATPGCVLELRGIAGIPELLEKTLVWMPYAEHKGVAKGWNQTKSMLNSAYRLPEYDERGLLYRPNADFSIRTGWHPKKSKLGEAMEQVLSEMPRSAYSLQFALAKLDQEGLKW